MLTTNQVCEMLHITSRTLYKYAEMGYITRHKINQTLNMYEYDDVRALAMMLSDKKHNPNNTACKMAISVTVHKHK